MYSNSKFLKNCIAKKTIIGLMSMPPKSGRKERTLFRIGSCTRLKNCVNILTNGCQGFIILKLTSQEIITYATRVNKYMSIILFIKFNKEFIYLIYYLFSLFSTNSFTTPGSASVDVSAKSL